MKLDELIARLERATGPDRELDGDIAVFMGLYARRPQVAVPPAYTSSLDAALTLVPDHASSWDCGRVDKDFMASVEFPVDIDGFHNYRGRSQANAAIALAAAALKSRQVGG